MSTLISLNGCVEPELFEFLHENFGFSQVLGVDGGTRHLLKAGIKPNMVIGDLDSIGPYLGEVFALKVPMLISYPIKILQMARERCSLVKACLLFSSVLGERK